MTFLVILVVIIYNIKDIHVKYIYKIYCTPSEYHTPIYFLKQISFFQKLSTASFSTCIIKKKKINPKFFSTFPT